MTAPETDSLLVAAGTIGQAIDHLEQNMIRTAAAAMAAILIGVGITVSPIS